MKQNTVRDTKGHILYRTVHLPNEIKVYDGSTLLGTCSNGQTRDAHGVLISNSESPGLLVKKY